VNTLVEAELVVVEEVVVDVVKVRVVVDIEEEVSETSRTVYPFILVSKVSVVSDLMLSEELSILLTVKLPAGIPTILRIVS
jgi:hypothetical protein